MLASVVAAGAVVGAGCGVAVGSCLRHGGRCGGWDRRLSRRQHGNRRLRWRARPLERWPSRPRPLRGWSADADGDGRLLIGPERGLRRLGWGAGHGNGGGWRNENGLARRTGNLDIESAGAERRRGGQEDGQGGDADEQSPGRTPLIARQDSGDGKGASGRSFLRVRRHAHDPVRWFDRRPIGMIGLSGRRVWILLEVVDRADEPVAGAERIGFIVPEAAKAWRRGRLSRPLQTRQRIRRDVANPTGANMAMMCPAAECPSRMRNGTRSGSSKRLPPGMATKSSRIPSRRSTGSGRSQAARHLENDLSAADEDDSAVGDDHACREVDIVADEEDLTFPDDAVGLQRSPDGATRPADRWHIVRRTMLLFIAVRHACFPRCSRSGSWQLTRGCPEWRRRDARYWRGSDADGSTIVTGRHVRTVYHSGSR